MMIRGGLIILIVSCLILSSANFSSADESSFLKGKVKIVDFSGYEEEKITPGEDFTVFVTLRNDGILWKRVFIRVDLVDDLTGLVRKEIGTSNRYELIWPFSENTYLITCKIDEADVEWYKSYSISAVVFRKLCRGLIVSDSTTPQGIEIENLSLEKLLENTKVRITNFDVPDTVKSNEEFDVTVSVRNWGDVSTKIWIRVDLVKPSPIGIPGIEGIGAIREEIGHSDNTPEVNQCEENDYEISCRIPKANKGTHFRIQAVLFTFLEGNRIEIDSSTMRSSQLSWWERVKMGFMNSIGAIVSLILTVVILVALSVFVARVIWNKEINIMKCWKKWRKKKKKG